MGCYSSKISTQLSQWNEMGLADVYKSASQKHEFNYVKTEKICLKLWEKYPVDVQVFASISTLIIKSLEKEKTPDLSTLEHNLCKELHESFLERQCKMQMKIQDITIGEARYVDVTFLEDVQTVSDAINESTIPDGMRCVVPIVCYYLEGADLEVVQHQFQVAKNFYARHQVYLQATQFQLLQLEDIKALMNCNMTDENWDSHILCAQTESLDYIDSWITSRILETYGSHDVLSAFWFPFLLKKTQLLVGTSFPDFLYENKKRCVLMNASIQNDLVFAHELAHMVTNLDHPTEFEQVNPQNPRDGVWTDPVKSASGIEDSVSMKYNILTAGSRIERLWQPEPPDLDQLKFEPYQLKRIFDSRFGRKLEGKSIGLDENLKL